MRKKPDKPSPDFPLFAHDAGQWAKKIKGKTCYFGKWDNPKAALAKYTMDKDFLAAGMNPSVARIQADRAPSNNLRLGDACNIYLDRQFKRAATGEIRQRSYLDSKKTLAKLLTILEREMYVESIMPLHWSKVRTAISVGCGPTTISNNITRIKMCFKWLSKNEYIKRQINFGDELSKPKKADMRKAKRQYGVTAFQASEIKFLLKKANVAMRAMILLGVNCGLGNSDIAKLQTSFIDLKNGWLDFAREKTGVDRRAKLWPETIKAIKTYQKIRPAVTITNLFVTTHGNLYSHPDKPECAIARAFGRLCKDNGLHVSRRGFYGLRRTCESAGGASKDQVAVNFVMGHIDHTMAGEYRQWIDDDRLIAVSDTIHGWLFG